MKKFIIVLLPILMSSCFSNQSKTEQKSLNDNNISPFYNQINLLKETKRSLGLHPLEENDVRIWLSSSFIFEYVITIHPNAKKTKNKQVNNRGSDSWSTHNYSIEIIEFWQSSSNAKGDHAWDVKIDSFNVKRFYSSDSITSSVLTDLIRDSLFHPYFQNHNESFEKAKQIAGGEHIIIERKKTDGEIHFNFYPCPKGMKIKNSENVLNWLKKLDKTYKFIYFQDCYKCLWHDPEFSKRYKTRYPQLQN